MTVMFLRHPSQYRRLDLPLNAHPKNMFLSDVKLLCFLCQTLKFLRPNLSLGDLKWLCFRCQTLKFSRPNVKFYQQNRSSRGPLSLLSSQSRIWGKPAKITDMERWKSIEDSIWVGFFKVWPLKHGRLRSRKLKFGRGNFKVWHLKHRRLTSLENMFLARVFTVNATDGIGYHDRTM